MPRPRSRVSIERSAIMDLLIGPVPGGLTEEQLAVAWDQFGDEIMRDSYDPPGTRPWAWWAFEAGEDRPAGSEPEAVRLAELGELGADELAALRERANEARLRIGTAREHISALGTDLEQRPDRDAVGLLEAVEAARERATARMAGPRGRERVSPWPQAFKVAAGSRPGLSVESGHDKWGGTADTARPRHHEARS
jgi:hypothetical protein